MKRYRKANEEISLPAELVKRTVAAAEGDSPRRAPVRRAAPVAALLAAALIVGTAAWVGALQRENGLPGQETNTTHTGDSGESSITTERTGEMHNPIFINAYAEALAAPSYPEMAPYPDESAFVKTDGSFDADGFSAVYDAWREDKRARLDQPAGYTAGAEHFFAASVGTMLAPTPETEKANRLYSPLSIYMALAMLAEVTDGESRAQILSLAGTENMEMLHNQAGAVWRANYSRDGALTSLLASSLWLNERVRFNQSTLNRLADTYYASSYRGTMGSSEMNELLRSWLNDNTGGLLEEYTRDIAFDVRTVMALATTVFYQAKWTDTFSAANTAPGIFHGGAGDESADFMHKSSADRYFWSEHFSAVAQPLNEGGEMWLILPDEGVSVDALLEGENLAQVLAMVDEGEQWADSKRLIVNLALPKFDVSAELDLCDALKTLGVTDVFDAETADFSPLLDASEASLTDELYLSEAKHAARVKIDEEGCTAAAYTVMMVAGNGMPPRDEVDFVLDRPFLFILTGADDLPLFTGVVNRIN